MNTDKIRELLNYIKSTKSYTAFSSIEFQPLIDLAERYLAVSAQMPKKYTEEQGIDNEMECYNQAIDDCTIAVTKMLLEQDINHATVTKCADGYYVTYKTSKVFHTEEDLNKWIQDNKLEKQMTGQGFEHYIYPN